VAGGPSERPGAPAVRFSSCYPFLGDLHFVVPPRTLWPPAASPKVRWKNARFVPLEVVAALAAERPLDDGAWYIDGLSECLLPVSAQLHGGPFRPAMRSRAAVDRVGAGSVVVHQAACLEFTEGAGLWTLASFADEEAQSRWGDAVRTALRVLADSGFGGERSTGWGGSAQPEFVEGALPDLILPPKPAAPPVDGPVEDIEAPPKPVPETGYWLLSLFSPGPQDAVDWQRGSYSLVSRGGRVESPARSGDLKKLVRMVEEGSVLAAEAPPTGAAPDVAPDGFPHPVYRAGFALAVPVPLRQPERPLGAS